MPEALHAFEASLHQAFLVSFAITLVAALASVLRHRSTLPAQPQHAVEMRPKMRQGRSHK